MAQANQADKVGHRHQAVDDVGQQPNHIQMEEGTARHQHQIDEAVRFDRLHPEQVLGAALAVVVPTKDGGKGEEQQANAHQILADMGIKPLGKGLTGHGGAAHIAAPHPGHHQGQAGHGADDDGVDEGTGHGDQPLLHTGVCLGRRRRDGRRAQSRLVGEDPARHPGLNGQHDAGTNEATGRRVAGEGTPDHQSDRLRQGSGIVHQHAEASNDVEDGHERHHLARHAGDGLDAPQCHQRHDQGQHHGCHFTGYREGEAHGVTDGVHLRESTDPEEGDADAEQGKQLGQRPGAEPLLQIVHGAASHLAVGILLAIFDRQQTLGVLGSHAKQRCHPHPEQGPRAPQLDGGGHPDDVAGAYRCRKRGTEGAEAGDIPLLALALIAAKDQTQSERQAHHLKQTQTQSEVDTGPDQQDQQGWPPDKAIDGG